MAQSVEHLTLAQVMISELMSSSPASGSVLTAQSLEPASDSVPPSLSAPTHLHSVSVSLKNKGRLKQNTYLDRVEVSKNRNCQLNNLLAN